jgi:hypothetical protein
MEMEEEEQLKKKTDSNGEQPPQMEHNKEGLTIIECILSEVPFEFGRSGRWMSLNIFTFVPKYIISVAANFVFFWPILFKK